MKKEENRNGVSSVGDSSNKMVPHGDIFRIFTNLHDNSFPVAHVNKLLLICHFDSLMGWKGISNASSRWISIFSPSLLISIYRPLCNTICTKKSHTELYWYFNCFSSVPPTVPPMLWIPHQLIGATAGNNITLECFTEAHP